METINNTELDNNSNMDPQKKREVILKMLDVAAEGESNPELLKRIESAKQNLLEEDK